MTPSPAYAKTGTESRLTFLAEGGRVAMVLALLKAFAGALLSAFKPRASLGMEELARRQQLAILRRATPRPKLCAVSRPFGPVLPPRWARRARHAGVAGPQPIPHEEQGDLAPQHAADLDRARGA